jgi:putative thiamine transport system ATP-binding protein|tara:strand:- start:232 stop:849 length:618 start_codon:yes stop_codon:yes gene_type:complete
MLECKNINIQNDKNISLVENLNFRIEKSQIFTLTGPSGVGKSTLLKYICGIKQNFFTYSGDIFVNKSLVNLLPTNERGVRMIFQNDLLFPHMNVLENLLFAAPITDKKNKDEALFLLDKLNLSHLSYKNTNTLSGGEYSRICLARIIINKPSILLVDEPFSNLDAKTKNMTREFFFKNISEMKCATLIVSHDLDDIYNYDKVIKL